VGDVRGAVPPGDDGDHPVEEVDHLGVRGADRPSQEPPEPLVDVAAAEGLERVVGGPGVHVQPAQVQGGQGRGRVLVDECVQLRAVADHPDLDGHLPRGGREQDPEQPRRIAADREVVPDPLQGALLLEEASHATVDLFPQLVELPVLELEHLAEGLLAEHQWRVGVEEHGRGEVVRARPGAVAEGDLEVRLAVHGCGESERGATARRPLALQGQGLLDLAPQRFHQLHEVDVQSLASGTTVQGFPFLQTPGQAAEESRGFGGVLVAQPDPIGTRRGYQHDSPRASPRVGGLVTSVDTVRVPSTN